VKGVLLSGEVARELGEPILLRLLRGREGDAAPELSADALKEAAGLSKKYVAEDRYRTGDQEEHRDPADDRYEHNLNLPHLQEHDHEGHFAHREWNHLDPLLRPLSFRILQNKGLNSEDGEEVFNETLAAMAHGKGTPKRAPVEELIVFEEMIPHFCRRLGFRAIDHIRRQTSQKARPEHLQSLEGMMSEEGSTIDLADPAADDMDRPDSWRFEEIYSRCRELLSPLEWNLVFDLYVAQNYTVKDLIADPEKLASLGIKNGRSASTLRKRVDDIVNPALEKLAIELAL
jgi:hypothetical protein